MNTSIKNRFSLENIKRYVITHKKISIVLVLIIVIGIYLLATSGGTNGETQYTLTSVQKGSIVSSVVGTGQVSASNQVEVKSKVSGAIVTVAAQAGQEVKAGTLIAQVNTRDAEIALENAKISLEKLTQPSDASTILQAQNAVVSAQESVKKAETDLTKSYDDGFNTITSSLLDLPDVLSGLNDLFYTRDGYLGTQSMQSYQNSKMWSYRTTAGVSYDAAKSSYDTVLAEYKNISRNSATSSIERVLSDTCTMTTKVAQALKDAKAAVDYFKDVQQQAVSGTSAQNSAIATEAQSSIITWTSKINTDVTSLLSAKSTISNSQSSLESAQRDVQVKSESFTELQAGADPLDVRSQELALKEKQYAYEDYFIRAPFDGVIASLDVKKGDEISSGSTIGTFITKQKIAVITLNEVDAAKVKTGNKVTLTFDAVEGLSIAGQVSETDLVGTVSQGVVSYEIKIAFDTQDDRIKPGMSVSASIITDTQQDVLVLSNNAVKSRGEMYYVQVFDSSLVSQGATRVTTATAPQEKTITIGSSDDTNTEISSGLTEGEVVVLKSSSSTAKTTTNSSTSKTGTTKSILQSVSGGGGEPPRQ